jgi:hypothetical protein
MVICSSCQKKFKKPHGLSLHRNKCSKLQSEPAFRAQHASAILKFKKIPEKKKHSQFIQEDLNGQDDLVRIFLISTQKFSGLS